MLYSEHYGLKLVKEENFDYAHKDYMSLSCFGKSNIHFNCGFITIQAESLYDLCWNVNIDYNLSYKSLSIFVMELLYKASLYINNPVIHVTNFERSDENVDIEDGFYSLNKVLKEHRWIDKEVKE